jgi:hypothetical protein
MQLTGPGTPRIPGTEAAERASVTDSDSLFASEAEEQTVDRTAQVLVEDGTGFMLC